MSNSEKDPQTLQIESYISSILAEIEPSSYISEDVRNAFRKVPRKLFAAPDVPDGILYTNHPSEKGATKPSIMAIMTQVLMPLQGQIIFELGSRTGYQSAILAELAGPQGHVYTIERDQEMAIKAQQRLQHAGYKNVTVLIGDGTKGIAGSFSRGMITAGICGTGVIDDIPENIRNQMAIGSLLIAPIGEMRENGLVYGSLTGFRKITESNFNSASANTEVYFTPLIQNE